MLCITLFEVLVVSKLIACACYYCTQEYLSDTFPQTVCGAGFPNSEILMDVQNELFLSSGLAMPLLKYMNILRVIMKLSRATH
jgi:hypothetical protein